MWGGVIGALVIAALFENLSAQGFNFAGSGFTVHRLIFIPLYASKGANNHGFLAATLRSEYVLEPAEDQPLSHTLGNVKSFKAAIAKLVKAKTDLHDKVAVGSHHK